MSKQYGTFYSHNARDIPGEYFPMPKSIFRLGLTAGEILVYTYLMYCEDRKTFQCHPSYATIGEAVNMSNNTVAKHVEGLVRKGLITTERTTVKISPGCGASSSLSACSIRSASLHRWSRHILKNKYSKHQRG